MLICLRLVVRLMSESALPWCAACDHAGSATYVGPQARKRTMWVSVQHIFIYFNLLCIIFTIFFSLLLFEEDDTTFHFDSSYRPEVVAIHGNKNVLTNNP